MFVSCQKRVLSDVIATDVKFFLTGDTMVLVDHLDVKYCTERSCNAV
jgi:hypothetical protein